MALTRLIAETKLVGADLTSGRAGRLLVRYTAYDPATAMLGSIASLNDFLMAGLAAVGITPADPDLISDADLAGVTDRVKFLDHAELAAREWALAAMIAPDERTGTQTQNWGSLRKQFSDELAAFRLRLDEKYGETGILSGGVVDLNFDRSGDCGWDGYA